ncbi:GTPase HflX [Alkalihalobacillus sp. LMS39]|uniref:GTPase HflX n=1 Tax=Alkalihalobacillus sp. LMS39 TaxID=2924032 RepID=UPI001FB3F79F|nr:GTPase HflX [Alkalihalobacillus sp. LMS39]UOE92761.1 GTPase HflX [Alkalihalobacillus sp. LMS39]
MIETKEKDREVAILVGCHTLAVTEESFLYSMEELASLTGTAEGVVAATVTQKRDKLDAATYIGRGKVEEVAKLVEEHEADLVIFNDELTSSQVRNLSSACDARIIDRTQLILDIFSRRAQSKEGKLQVELAQLNYLLPRLTGRGLALSRLGGGIGTRGPGETQLETDRRHIRRRMDDIKGQLQAITTHRSRYRERRKLNQVLQVTLVGYTNAGKSTILNRLTEAETVEENLLFATLDPTTKRMKLPSGLTVLLSDTVGFIQDLPTALIAAFRSTLEEVVEGDLLLHVVDGSNPNHTDHEKTVMKLLEELKATHIPMLTVYNKADKITDEQSLLQTKNSIVVSALQPDDLKKLKQEVETMIKDQLEFYRVFIPAGDGKLLARCKQETVLEEQVWNDEKEGYELAGYVHPDVSLAPLLKNLKK